MRTFRYRFFFILCIITSLLRLNLSVIYADTVLSDPDFISTGVEYRGVPDIRLGDTFTLGDFSFGGMAEIRNEKRFNQGILPNHNWRGFFSLYYSKTLPKQRDSVKITAGFEHESAHPTMGFNDGNTSAYDKVYDSTYRNINMNSIVFRISSIPLSGHALTLTGDMQYYFYSRNTPELPVNRLTWSGGISGGIEFKYPVFTDMHFFISAFDRYIFQSSKKTDAYIYYDTGNTVETRLKNYPIINNVNTLSLKTGIILNSYVRDRKISLFFGMLYGNIYGFVDSREKRLLYSFGIDFFH